MRSPDERCSIYRYPPPKSNIDFNLNDNGGNVSPVSRFKRKNNTEFAQHIMLHGFPIKNKPAEYKVGTLEMATSGSSKKICNRAKSQLWGASVDTIGFQHEYAAQYEPVRRWETIEDEVGKVRRPSEMYQRHLLSPNDGLGAVDASLPRMASAKAILSPQKQMPAADDTVPAAGFSPRVTPCRGRRYDPERNSTRSTLVLGDAGATSPASPVRVTRGRATTPVSKRINLTSLARETYSPGSSFRVLHADLQDITPTRSSIKMVLAGPREELQMKTSELLSSRQLSKPYTLFTSDDIAGLA